MAFHCLSSITPYGNRDNVLNCLTQTVPYFTFRKIVLINKSSGQYFASFNKIAGQEGLMPTEPLKYLMTMAIYRQNGHQWLRMPVNGCLDCQK